MNNTSTITNLSGVSKDEDLILWGDTLRNFNYWVKDNFSENEISQENLVSECKKFEVFIKNFGKVLNEDGDIQYWVFVRGLIDLYFFKTKINSELRIALSKSPSIQYPIPRVSSNKTVMGVFYDDLVFEIKNSLDKNCDYSINKKDPLLKSVIKNSLTYEVLKEILDSKRSSLRNQKGIDNYLYYDLVLRDIPVNNNFNHVNIN